MVRVHQQPFCQAAPFRTVFLGPRPKFAASGVASGYSWVMCDSTSAAAAFVAPLVPRLGPTGKPQNDWQSAAVGKISILCVGTVAVAALRPTLGNDTVGSTANRGLTSCAGFACILSCACGTRHAVMTAYSHHAELVWLKPAC